MWIEVVREGMEKGEGLDWKNLKPGPKIFVRKLHNLRLCHKISNFLN